MDNNKIGKFIASRRKEKGLTQQELGNNLFVTDKAVSKWERGLSLPDITIIEKLANELDTDIYSILQVEKKDDINIEKILQEERIKIKRLLKRKTLIFVLPIIFVGCIILFKLIPFGYNIEHIRYTHTENKIINLGVPKFSFLKKNNENSYSYKSFRGKSILKSELKNYVNTLEHISCNNTTYFYDSDANITIIDYYVKGNIFYNTISYNIRNGNYCNDWQIKEYSKKLGVLNAFRTLYAEESNLIIQFLPSLKINNNQNEWIATLDIYYNDGKTKKVIERSSGTFEIINDELIYYRTKIMEHENDIEIPNVSNFVIKEQKLILKENYLKDYEKSITLK